ncbi:MAG: hypothetical protein WDN04_03150 [Rhodospirillales bacterium]
MKQADTLEALAGQIGIDPLALRHTVDRYNRFCEAGRDGRFQTRRPRL